MKAIAKVVAALVVLCSFASPLQAAEGLLMVESTVSGTTTRTTQVQIERERMRAELSGPTGGTQLVIFDGPQQVLRIVNVDKKSYTEMTKADADQMAARATAMMAAMKEKIASLPPDERAKSEAMMALVTGGRGGGPAARPEFKRAGSDKVGKWTCDKYEGFRSAEKVSEVCTVDPATLGLTPADFEISKQVAAFFQTMLPLAGDQFVGVGTIETHGFNGIPVRRISYRAGKPVSTSEVIQIGRQTFAASTYEVPAGFQKQSMVGIK